MSEQGPSEVPLSFEVWADISARLSSLDRDRQFDILDECKVKPKDWQRSDEHYLQAMAADIAAGRMDRVNSYGHVCVAEMKRRQTQGAPPAANEAPRVPTMAPQGPTTIGAPLDAPSVATPSFLQPQQAPARPVGPAPQELAGTMDAFQLPTALKGGALPFRSSPHPSPLATAAEAKPPQAAGAGGETLSLSGTLPMATPLPFGTASVASPSAPSFPRLPLPIYAAFCAECAAYPDKLAEVLKRYNVRGDAARIALDEDWQARFDAHPGTRAEWERLVAEHRAKLAGQPPR